MSARVSDGLTGVSRAATPLASKAGEDRPGAPAPLSSGGDPATATGTERRFAFAPGLVLVVRGDAGSLRHVGAEYGAARERRAHDAVCAAVETELVAGLPGALRFAVASMPSPPGSAAARLAGGRSTLLEDSHRTTRWRARLDSPDEPTLTARIEASGPLGRAFAQGFVIEPLLAIAAARRGLMLVPGAAIEIAGELVLLVGGSHVGKTTVALGALARGAAILGDDQVLVGPDGIARPFPRRPRVYADLPAVDPVAAGRLDAGTRLRLALAGGIGRATGGGLSIPVLAPQPSTTPPPTPIGRVILVERVGGPPTAGRLGAEDRRARSAGMAPTSGQEPIHPSLLVETIASLAAGQRERFARGVGPPWRSILTETATLERAVLRAALGTVPAGRILLPASLDAAGSAATLRHALGLEPDRSSTTAALGSDQSPAP